jgi:phenylacetate-coenzyme A ligase PaaK-like adenylate-forming protein
VEFDASDRLIITTLDLHTRIPLIRYATGDKGGFVQLPPHVRSTLEAHGVPWEPLQSIPIVSILGRGHHALGALTPVYPEAVKEGIYSDPALAALTTANFRLISDPSAVLIRIQLSPGVISTPHIEDGFRNAIARFVDAPYAVVCEGYEAFGSGMALDYERKFQYLGP